MGILKDLKKKVENAKEAYLKLAGVAPEASVRKASDVLKEAGLELANAIVAGCEPCPNCEQMPHGMIQATYIEIGCTNCIGHTVGAREREDAVEAWNGEPSKDWPESWIQLQKPARAASVLQGLDDAKAQAELAEATAKSGGGNV